MVTLSSTLTATAVAKATAGDADPSRSHIRYRRIALSGVAGLLQKLVSVSTGFISVPFMVKYLGAEQFGIWLAFMGFITILQFTDLGLGIGLQNHLTECDGTGDYCRPRRLLSSTLAVMTVMAACLLFVALFILHAVPLDRIVRTVSAEARGQLLPCARMFLFAFAVILPVGLVQYICNAYQRAYWTSGVIATANLLTFAGMLIGVSAKLPLWWFIFIGTIAPAPVYFIAGAAILNRKPWLTPTPRAFSISEVRRVVKLGLPAFGAQVGGTLMLQCPTLAIAGALGASAVGPYALSQQLLSVAGVMLTVVMAPLWPAYGEAAARRDTAWIKRTFRRSLWGSLVLAGTTSLLAAILGRPIIQAWAGKAEVVPSTQLLLACGTWAAVLACSRAFLMLLNGLGRMNAQAVYGIILPAVCIALGYRFAPAVGAAGVVWIIVLFGEIPRALFSGLEVSCVFRSLRHG
jgi:O-antigen/teichoic acid export membrane protein